MRHILKPHTNHFPNDSQSVRLQNLIAELDTVAIRYEKLWGVDRLPRLVSDTTRAKWDAQMDKLNLALQQNDVGMAQELATGCIRGWQVMDAEAKAAGHMPPQKPEAWVCRMGKRNLAIVATEDDAMIYQAHAEPNTVIWPLQAIANLVGEQYKRWDGQLSAMGKNKDEDLPERKPELFSDEIPF